MMFFGGSMHGQNMVARFQQATHSATATILLQRIHYWCQNGKGRQHDGLKWVVNTYEQWAVETGLTMEQVKYALGLLRQAHLITTVVVRGWAGTHLHVRETQRTEVLASGNEPPTLGEIPTDGQGISHLQEQGEEYQGETQGEELSEGPAVLSQEASGEPDKSPGKETEMIKVKSVNEVQAAVKTKEFHHKPDSLKALEARWRKHIVAEGGVAMNFTAKQYAQLKGFQKACGALSAEEALTYVLDHWAHFTARAKTATGLTTAPSEPHCGFLLQHVGIAVSYYSSNKSQPMKQEVPAAIIFVKKLQSIAIEDQEPTTLEEILSYPSK